MKTVRMFINALSGTIQLADLPGKMEVMILYDNQLTGSLDLDRLPAAVRSVCLYKNQITANPTKGHLSVVGWTSTPVLGEAKNLSKNPSSCFCHGTDPIDGHRKVVGQDQYPALGEVRETAKLLPRGQSPWWRDEGRHLLILCLFSIRGMRLAHMHNAKSREHAHTCRKARAIFKLRYKNKKTKRAQWNSTGAGTNVPKIQRRSRCLLFWGKP